LTSSAVPATFTTQPGKAGLVSRVNQWLHAMPHPSLVVEIAPRHVAAARWGATKGRLEAAAVETLPAGSVMPSPVETNIPQPEAVRGALRRVFQGVPIDGASLALLIPDSAVRVFILPFDTLPRRAREALPLLRWRLKKSVPFDVDETVVSWFRQTGRTGGLEVVAAIARQRIVREYEQIVESLAGHAGVVMGSSLAAVPLLPERGSRMLVRLSGKTLTTAVVNGSNLCVFRSTELPAEVEQLQAQNVIEEVFPAVAYYQDTWKEQVDGALLSGFGDREEFFRTALESELKIRASAIADAESVHGLEQEARDLVHHGLDSLAGWMMNEGS